MHDEIKPTDVEVSKDPSGPVITTKNESTEVLDANGRPLGGETPLSKIFDKIADGTDAKTAVKEVMRKPVVVVDEQAQKETKPPTVEDEGNKRPLFDEQKEDVVVEKKVEAKAPEPKVEAKPEDEVSESDLQVLPHDKPKTAQRISALLKKSSLAQEMAENTKKELEIKANRLSELEEELNKVKSVDPLTDEKVKGHLEELAMYRRRYDLENSDDVKQKFDGRVTGAEEAIQSTLASRGAPESLIAEIKAEGGWLKFIDSNRVISLASGKEMPASELAEAIKQNLPHSERRKIEALELEQVQAQRDKQTYFQEETKKAKDYFATKENQTREQALAQKKQFDDAVKVVAEWRTKFREENQWLKEQEVPANATAEQKAALEDHNTHAKQLNSLMERHLQAKDINQMLEVLVDSIKYHQERRNLAKALADNKKLQDSLKAKQDELDKFKKAGSSVRSSGSLFSSGTRSESSTEKKAPPSLEDAFAALEQGKSLDS
jgi:hypothetical protein